MALPTIADRVDALRNENTRKKLISDGIAEEVSKTLRICFIHSD